MTGTYTSTYTTADIENVMRNFKADLLMIAESSDAMGTSQARDIADDILTLSKDGYITYVDVTLLQYNIEKRAVRYTVTETGSELASSRPGGVVWERLPNAVLRVVINHTSRWHALGQSEQQRIERGLRRSWKASYDDLSHASLRSNGGRNFTSNDYGLTRKDFS